MIVGLPALRIQGLFLAVTTLSFAFAVNNFVLRREFFAWLVPKDATFVDRPVLWGRLDLASDSKVLWFTVSSDAKFYFVCLGLLGSRAWHGASRCVATARAGCSSAFVTTAG